MNHRHACFILTVSLGFSGPLLGEDAAAPKVPPYVLKNRSTFAAVGEELRAPFWPIGWSKRQPLQATSAVPVRAVETPKVVLDPKSFKLSSVLLGNPSLAIINGRTYSEGEFMRAPKSVATAPTAPTAAPVAPAARIRIYRINDGSVILQCQEQLITVPLNRPELVQRSNVEELLNEDRP